MEMECSMCRRWSIKKLNKKRNINQNKRGICKATETITDYDDGYKCRDFKKSIKTILIQIIRKIRQ